ncbi:MAG TPA: immunoglobulin domain-containing protein [Methylomirabilota bacterium]|nr:immunoglobulin domain-containing protein [Methylomirabilota bacterium]
MTPLVAQGSGGTTVDYFRTKFMWNSSTVGLVITTTNYVDDGLVFYLNGVEVGRFNMPQGEVLFNTQATTANPGGEPVVTRVQLDPSPLVEGENTLAVSLHQAGTASSDKVFGLGMYIAQAVPPSFTTQPVNTAVTEGNSVSLISAATGIPTPTYQWYFGGNPIDPSVNPTATNATLVINNAQLTDAGDYYVVASNPSGSTPSATATLTVNPDQTAPSIVLACLSSDGLTITVLFSEPMDDTRTELTDPFTYLLENAVTGDPVVEGGVVAVGLNGADGVILTLDPGFPLDPNTRYALVTSADLYDRFNNPLSAGARKELSPEVTIREGLNGFAGTSDTEIGSGDIANTDQGAVEVLVVDTADRNGMVQSLLKIDAIGNGPNQVPPGSIINRATLIINQTDPTDAGTAAAPRLHALKRPFSESDTWNTLVGGISLDDVEAAMVPDALVPSADVNGSKSIDVTARVQAWSDGEPNHGWVINPNSGNGWRWNSSEAASETARPTLVICYTRVVSPIEITQEPQGGTFPERSRVVLSVAVRGSDPVFQWRKNGIDIPGANSASLVLDPAVPADSGTYSVHVSNDIPSEDTSADAVVTITPDTVRPTVVSVTPDANLTDVTIVFSEPVSQATAEAPGSYSLNPALAVSSATLTSPNTVRLVTAPRTYPNDYVLTIQGIRDLAVAQNLLDPNPTVVTLHTRAWRVVDSSATWRYQQTDDVSGDGWQNPGYDASAWPEGQGLFGLESAGVINGLNYPSPAIRTPLTIGATQPAYYFRSTVNLPTITSGMYVLRGYFDDSAVIYLDGALVARIRYTNDVPAYDFSNITGPPTEGQIDCVKLPTMGGSHLLAIEVHNASGTSSDIVMGAEIAALVQPELRIVRTETGVTVSWDPDPNWQLVSSATVDGTYAPVAGNPNGSYSVSNPTGNLFYQLRCR